MRNEAEPRLIGNDAAIETREKTRAKQLAKIAEISELSLTERYVGTLETFEQYYINAIKVLQAFEQGLEGGRYVISDWIFRSDYFAEDQSRLHVPLWATIRDGITANSPTNTQSETLFIFTTDSEKKLRRHWELIDAENAVGSINIPIYKVKLAQQVAEFFAPKPISLQIPHEVRAGLKPPSANNITEAFAILIQLGVITKEELIGDIDEDLVTTKIKAFVTLINNGTLAKSIIFTEIDLDKLPNIVK